jgi:septum formation protein
VEKTSVIDPADQHPLWLGTSPLVLASQSRTRFDLLIAAGIPVDIVPSHIDERAIAEPLIARGASAQQVAVDLACAKALTVSKKLRDRLTLGADQTLACDGVMLHKPNDRKSAVEQLSFLSGRTHHLYSAVSLSSDFNIVASFVETAKLTMRVLSPAMIERYLDAAGDAVFDSVGGYQLERLGIHLFKRVSGDQTTILGLSMVPLLDRLRKLRMVAE